MKKNLLLSLLFILTFFCFSFSGCTTKYVGVYKFHKTIVNYNEQTTIVKPGDITASGFIVTEDYLTFQLKSDGTAIRIMDYGSSNKWEDIGTWEHYSDNVLILIFEDDVSYAKYKNFKLTFEQNGSKIILRKKLFS